VECQESERHGDFAMSTFEIVEPGSCWRSRTASNCQPACCVFDHEDQDAKVTPQHYISDLSFVVSTWSRANFTIILKQDLAPPLSGRTPYDKAATLLYPGSIDMLRWLEGMHKDVFHKARTLELAAGLALASIYAGLSGAISTATDISQDAMSFAKVNAKAILPEFAFKRFKTFALDVVKTQTIDDVLDSGLDPPYDIVLVNLYPGGNGSVARHFVKVAALCTRPKAKVFCTLAQPLDEATSAAIHSCFDSAVRTSNVNGRGVFRLGSSQFLELTRRSECNIIDEEPL